MFTGRRQLEPVYQFHIYMHCVAESLFYFVLHAFYITGTDLLSTLQTHFQISAIELMDLKTGDLRPPAEKVDKKTSMHELTFNGNEKIQRSSGYLF